MTAPQPNRRRLFRFRLRTLLALPLLFALAWWWVIWPERTATRFVALLSAGDEKAAQAMFDGPSLDEFWPMQIDELSPRKPPNLRPATWPEVFYGRRRFAAEESPGRVFHFEVERGRVHFHEVTAAYEIKHVSVKGISDLVRLFTDREDIRVVQVEGEQRVRITIPQDNFSPVKKPEWVHIGMGTTFPNKSPSRQTSEELHAIIAQLMPLVDKPENVNLPPVVWPFN